MDKVQLDRLTILIERCIEESIGWCVESRGCEPKDVLGYNGWIEDAKKFLTNIGNEMNKPHKHAEVIKAWADGAEIERFSTVDKDWVSVDSPNWYPENKYRIKPQPKTDIVFVVGAPDADGQNRCLEHRYSGETGEIISSRVLL